MSVQPLQNASGAELTRRYGAVMMNTFGTPKRVFVRG